MTTASMYQQLQDNIAQSWARVVRWPILLVLLLGVPFLEPQYALAAGALIGVPIALALYDAAQAQRQPDNPYQPSTPDDGDVLRYTPVGVGMSLLHFQEGLARYMRQKGIVERSQSVEKAYLDQVMDQMQPVLLDDEMDMRHGAIIGPTGAGKTEMIQTLLESTVARGGPVIVLNAKGDWDFLQRVYHIASNYDRADHVRIVDFDHPEISMTYNPVLSTAGVRASVSTVMKLNAEVRDEFFRDMNRSAVVTALVALHNQPDNPAYHFGDLGLLFNDPYAFHELFMNMPEDTQEQAEAKQFVWQWLQQWAVTDSKGEVYYDEASYRKFLKGLATKMLDFAHSEYRELVCSYQPDIEMYDAIVRRRIVVISMPALSDKEGLTLFGKLAMADIARAIGQIQANKTQPHVPCRVICEEYGSFKDETHQELWQLARSGGISLWLSIQSQGFLADLSQEFASNILSNVWHLFILGARDKETRELAAERGPTVLRQFQQSTTSESFQAAHRSTETGGERQESGGASVSTGYKEAREYLIQPEDIEFMDKGDALMIGPRGVLRMRLPMLEADDQAPALQRVSLPSPDSPRRPGLNLFERHYSRDAGRREALNQRTKERKS